MLYLTATVLFILWLLGLLSSYMLGGCLHVLPVIALVLVLVNFISERKRTSKALSGAGWVCELAVLACLSGGALAILKASALWHAGDALLCLGGAIGACTLVCYLYFQEE